MKPVMTSKHRRLSSFKLQILTDKLEADGDEEVCYEGKEVAARQSFNLHLANRWGVNGRFPIGRHSVRLSSCV
jgi:hypothetical protein